MDRKKLPEEQPVRGIYRLEKDGKVVLLSGELKIPNGLAFSPKKNYLYVTDTSDGCIYKFKVKPDGLTNKELFVKQAVEEGQSPIADGIKVDKLGNVYAAAFNGIAIYTPKGELIGRIELPKSPSNLAWGEDDYKTLYITCHNMIFTITTLIGG